MITAPLACRRCSAEVESGDLRCPVCAFAAAPGAEHGATAAAPAADVLRCDGCGAAVAYRVETQAPKCDFCSAVMRVERPLDPLETAELVLPFRVAPDLAQQALRSWMSTLGYFRPRDLAQAATLDVLRPIHWAAWIVDADALVSWTADSNAGSGRSQWAPHSGQSHMRFERILVSASRGLSTDEAGRLAASFDLGTAEPVAQAVAPAGVTTEQFDVQRSAARQILSRALAGTAAHRVQHGICPGSRFRKVQVAFLLERLRTRRVVLPTFVFAYRYRGTAYRAIVHGQDPKLVFGSAPYDWWKIAQLIVGGVAFIILVIVILAVLGNS